MYEKVPQELKELRQWVGWRLEPGNREGDKPRKVPIDPLTGGFAKSNDSVTWATFADAELAVNKYNLTGIGIMFANDIFGVDIDHCIDDGIMQDFASEIIREVRSYTELSPSGTGIHILCRGTLPPGGRRKGAVEMYCDGRFFTVTGNQYGESYPFDDCSDRIKAMHEKYIGGAPKPKPITKPRRLYQDGQVDMSHKAIIDRACAAANGIKFRDLYEGNWHQYSNDQEKQSLADMIFCSLLAFWCQGDEGLMDEIFRSSGLMRPKWDKRRGAMTYGEKTLQKAVATCNEMWTSPSMRERPPPPTEPPPLPSRAVPLPPPPPDEPTAPDEPGADNTPKEYQYDDTGNANRFRDENLGFIRFNYTENAWFIWDGQRWAFDETERIKGRADTMLDKMQDELMTVGARDFNVYKKHISRSRSHKGKDAFVMETQHLEGIPLLSGDLDRPSNILNVSNGMLSLKTGLLKSHERALLLSKLAKVEYDPEAICPIWDRFLDEITCQNEELKLYLQRMVGYCMTASTVEQVIFFLIGNGSNGKSTFVDTVAYMLGEYVCSAQPETIMYQRNRNNSARQDLARLKNARLVVTSEPGANCELDEGTVKQLTGGTENKITARFLYAKDFEFVPEFKVVMSTNYKPIIKGTDNGIWRRIRLIPFLASFTEDKKDKLLPEKLKQELSGILRWALEGAVGWYADGLPPCPLIDQAVQEYRSEMDKVQQFVEDCTYPDADCSLQSGVMYNVYRAWCGDQGDRYPISNTKFATELKKRFNHRKTSAYNEFTGVDFTARGAALAVLAAKQ